MFCVNFFHLKWEGKVYKMNFYWLWTEASTSFIMIFFLLRYKGADVFSKTSTQPEVPFANTSNPMEVVEFNTDTGS